MPGARVAHSNSICASIFLPGSRGSERLHMIVTCFGTSVAVQGPARQLAGVAEREQSLHCQPCRIHTCDTCRV